MSKSNSEHSKIKETDLVTSVVPLNKNVQPVYADQILQVALETNGVKLVLGYRVNNQVMNNAVVVLPMHVLFELQDTLKNFFSDKEMQKIILDSAANSVKILEDRFKQL